VAGTVHQRDLNAVERSASQVRGQRRCEGTEAEVKRYATLAALRALVEGGSAQSSRQRPSEARFATVCDSTRRQKTSRNEQHACCIPPARNAPVNMAEKANTDVQHSLCSCGWSTTSSIVCHLGLTLSKIAPLRHAHLREGLRSGRVA